MGEGALSALPYTTLDVFTSEPFSGNPVAVIWDADGLGAAQMQRIAAEFGYSETVFVNTANDPDIAAAMRIFTPTFELPFAGHPIVGAAVAFAERQAEGSFSKLVFHVAAGVVTVSLSAERQSLYAEFKPPQQPAILSDTRIELKSVIGVAQTLPVTTASAGTPFSYAELATSYDVDACFIGPGFHQMISDAKSTGLYIYAKVAAQSIYARLFAPEVGVPEDAATGSAVAALAAILKRDSWPDGRIHIKQGVKMGRPSDLYLTLQGEDGPYVGGRAVTMMQGTIRV